MPDSNAMPRFTDAHAYSYADARANSHVHPNPDCYRLPNRYRRDNSSAATSAEPLFPAGRRQGRIAAS